MVVKMNSKSSWVGEKNACGMLKITVIILATALAFRVLSSLSTGFSFLQISTFSASEEGKCDLFLGDWIPNPAGPSYTNETCNQIEEHQNCMKNGRPDSEYLHRKWKPRNCELPQFNAMRFLDTMKNKSWALIGDSITRNHVQSLICLLSKVEQPVLVNHDENYKSKQWKFPSYNLTVSVIWSPFLVEAAVYDDVNGAVSRVIELQLDKIDKKWMRAYDNLDYMIFSTGEWFFREAMYYENNAIVGCHSCHETGLTDLDFDFAYRKSLKTVLNFIASSSHKGLMFFRTTVPNHFEGGEWNVGGRCPRKVPFKDGDIELDDLHSILRRVELEEFVRASKRASQNGVRLKILDFMQLSLLRPDGHPGPYRHFHPFGNRNDVRVQNDCLHWCLPGPIDSWNDVLMEMLVDEF